MEKIREVEKQRERERSGYSTKGRVTQRKREGMRKERQKRLRRGKV